MRGPTASAAGATVYGDGWARRDVVRDDTVMTDDESGGGRRRSKHKTSEYRRSHGTGGGKSPKIGCRDDLGTKPRVNGLRTLPTDSPFGHLVGRSGCRRRSHAPPNPGTRVSAGPTPVTSAVRARTY
uniref:Uncharacterized protein n=1 Tax=Schizaphis graminum TaxID=13262 RepID=A0A2S2P3I9_SCHGA